MRNEIFMNFHFPARTATCAAAHDGSALPVTLHLFATRSLFPAPPEMPPDFARPVFRPARLTVPRLTTAPRFCVVTLRALRDGQLLVPPQKTPCACGATAFSPAGLAVSLLPGAPRFCVVTLRALRDGQLLVPPQKTPCACGATAFSPAGLAVSLLPGAPRFCVGAALVAARGRVWAPAPTSLQFLPSHMAAAPLAPTPHATQGADIHSIHRA